MKYYLIALTFFAITAKAQVPFNEKYRDCVADSPCYYCGDVPARYKKTPRDIRDRIQWSLDHGAIKWMSTSGRIFYEIQVDSTGHACVQSIKDETHMADVKENVRRCINGLRDWHPAEWDHHRINSTIILQLYFIGNIANVKFVKPNETM